MAAVDRGVGTEYRPREESSMRTSLADPVAFPELPIGRLPVRTVQRITTAIVVDRRAGPWAPCSEDSARVIRIGRELRATEELATAPAERGVTTPLTLHRRGERAIA
jgi:hypothetical protein